MTIRAEVDPEDQPRVDELLREHARMEGLFPQLADAARPDGDEFESAYGIRAYIRLLEQVADKMEQFEETMSDLIDEAQNLGWEGDD